MTSSSRRLLLPCLALLLLSAACELDEALAGSQQRFTEEFHHTYALAPGGRVELESFNGPVEIYGWDRAEVEINGSKYASRKDALDEIKIDIAHTPSAVVIKVIKPNWGTQRGRGSRGVRFRIHVPRRTQLDRIATSNGGLRLEGVEGRGRFITSNGAIRVVSYRGDVEARTSNGRITLEGFAGGASLTTSNGPIEARGLKGHVEAETSNGGIDIETAGLDPVRPVKLGTSNGPITISMSGKDDAAGPEVRARSSNGRIEVKLRDGAGARVRARTSNSQVSSDFPLNNVTTMSKSNVDATVGSGGPLLDLVTSNGPIRITRY